MTSPAMIRICWICGWQVPLETYNIDEYGEAVHEKCDVARLALNAYTAPPKKPQSQAKPQSGVILFPPARNTQRIAGCRPT
jgi:hypothetical protein